MFGGLPCALAACRGRALLGGDSPSPFPPSAAACVRRTRPFGGGPLPCLSAVGFQRRAHTLGVFFPLLLPHLSRAVVCGPMAVLSCCGPRASRTSFRCLRRPIVILMAQGLAVFSCSAVCAVKLLWQVPCAAFSRRRLHRLVRRRRPASSCRAVSAVETLPLVAQAVGGFLSPFPRPNPSSPRWYWDAVRAPGVSFPLGTSASLGVESS